MQQRHGSGCKQDPAGWDRSPNRRALPGFCSMACLPSESCWCRWHLTASCRLDLMAMADGRHLIVSRPFSFSVGICRPSPLGFQSAGRLKYSKPIQPQGHHAAEHSTDMTRALQPRRGIPRIRISRLPRVSRTMLPWWAWRQGGRRGSPASCHPAKRSQPEQQLGGDGLLHGLPE